MSSSGTGNDTPSAGAGTLAAFLGAPDRADTTR